MKLSDMAPMGQVQQVLENTTATLSCDFDHMSECAEFSRALELAIAASLQEVQFDFETFVSTTIDHNLHVIELSDRPVDEKVTHVVMHLIPHYIERVKVYTSAMMEDPDYTFTSYWRQVEFNVPVPAKSIPLNTHMELAPDYYKATNGTSVPEWGNYDIGLPVRVDRWETLRKQILKLQEAGVESDNSVYLGSGYLHDDGEKALKGWAAPSRVLLKVIMQSHKVELEHDENKPCQRVNMPASPRANLMDDLAHHYLVISQRLEQYTNRMLRAV